MIYGFTPWDASERHEVGALTTDIRVRVLNISAAGCLVETPRALDVGSVATLKLALPEGDFEDTVQIVRCQEIAGGVVHHVGVEFLTTAPPSVESLRYLVRRQAGRSIGWIKMAGDQ